MISYFAGQLWNSSHGVTSLSAAATDGRRSTQAFSGHPILPTTVRLRGRMVMLVSAYPCMIGASMPRQSSQIICF